ncbi:MAG: DUF1499 domain-containing protein [Candidatus Sericytochromatia bacterium]
MPKNTGLTANGRLQPPPASPNCVTSMSDPKDAKHYIEPIRYGELSREEARARLLEAVKGMPLAHLIKEQDKYLYFEFRTKMLKFTDDVEFLLPEDEPLIHMRSASRIGYSDWGTNRKRLEAVRAAFAAQKQPTKA